MPEWRFSVVAPDWVTKGCHLHIGGVEIVMRPDHRGGIVFRRFFAKDDDEAIRRTIAIADGLLADRGFRAKAREVVEGALRYLKGHSGRLGGLASGRQRELRELIRALDRLEAEDAHA